MTGRRLAILLASATLFLLAATVAWATGELSQKAAAAGCVSETGTGGACRDGSALDGALGVAASPDGRNVYVGSANSDAVAIFDRDPATGGLAQKPGSAGCVSDDGTGAACPDGTALDGTQGVAMSPDGRTLHAAAYLSDAVAVFDRATP